MRKSKLWKKLLGVDHLVLEGANVEIGPGGGEALVCPGAPVPPASTPVSTVWAARLPRPWGGGRRSRALDLGTMRIYLEADAPRVACLTDGVVVAAVPWARPSSRFTRAFEDQAVWLCAAMTTSKAADLLRTTWRSLAPPAGFEPATVGLEVRCSVR